MEKALRSTGNDTIANFISKPRYKIQFTSIGGWSDLKSSTGGEYITDTYSSREEAMEELKNLGSFDYVRIVTEETQEEFNCY